jgi:hypothetical protein
MALLGMSGAATAGAEGAACVRGASSVLRVQAPRVAAPARAIAGKVQVMRM